MNKTLRNFSYVMATALGLSQYSQAAEYLVKYKSEKAVNSIISMQTEMSGLEVKSLHRPGRLLKVNVIEKNKARTLAQIYNDKNVEYVVPNFKLRAFSAPVDTNALKEQYALAKVNAEAAWKRAGNRGNRSVLLAVIDTGVDYKHKNLLPNMVSGFDFRDNDSDPMDLTSQQNPGHGTHCAGIIGATGLVDGGIQGISPEVSIMPIRFLGADGSGSLEGGIKSIDYAIEKKVSVISASWGAAVDAATAKPLVEAIQRAEAAGIIFVAAAANDGKNNDVTSVYPSNAGTPNMISVSASNANDAKPSWSNYGKATVSLAAPGENIMSTLPADKYGNLSGTSMATPLVAGLVAFLKAQDPSLTGAEIRSLLQATGAKVQIETACNCRVDAFAAVDTLLSQKPWMVPAAATLAVGDSMIFKVKNAKGNLTFETSDRNIASIDETGKLTGQAQGTVTIKAIDSTGFTVNSLDINIGKPQSSNPGNPGDPGAPGECPLQDPALCQIMCLIQPDLPWCN